MFELLYKYFILQDTEFSEKTETRLDEKIEKFLQENEVEKNIKNRKDLEELLYQVAFIAHEEGFYCAMDWLQQFFFALLGKEKND